MVHQIINPSHSNDVRKPGFAGEQADARRILPTSLLTARHRSWTLGLPPRCDTPATSYPLVIAVGGGKGGVGKSMIAANLAAKLARIGLRVAALDMDCGGSNLHTYFGLSGVRRCLGDYVVHGNCSLDELFVPTPIEGLVVAASQRDDAWSVADSLQGAGLTRLWKGIQGLNDGGKDLNIDVIVLDLGAGSARHTIDLFCCAHVGVVAALPEPTSVENGYLFLRTTLFRLLENAGNRLNLGSQTEQLLQYLSQEQPGAPTKSYTEKMRAMYVTNPTLVGSIASVLSGRLMGIVVNQTRSQADSDIGKAMEMAAQRYFGFTAQYLGHLNYDEAAWKSLRNKRLLLLDFPQALITRRLSETATALLRNVGVNIG